jgi:5S rRNA maturation endonuclease (ribonuclease M5)
VYEILYRQYLEIPDKSANGNGFISGVRCSFHDDNKPSCSINKDTGVFVCPICGNYSAQRFIQTLTSCSKSEAHNLVLEFRSENNLIEYSTDKFITKATVKYNSDFDKLVKLSQELINPDLDLVIDFLDSKCLSYQTLIDKHVGYLTADLTHWKRTSLVFPYMYNGRVVAIRYRDINSSKGTEPNSHYTLFDLDIVNDQELVILTEGESDNLTVYEASHLPVISCPGSVFQKSWIRELQDVEQIILFPDCDQAGSNLVDTARKFLGNQLTVVDLPWQRKQIGKDLSDWVLLNGKEELVKLIEKVKTPFHRKVLTGFELDNAVVEEQDWLIKGLLARRQSCLIVGQPKTYKTWLAFNIISCLLTPGTNLFGLPELESVDDGIEKNILIVEEEGNSNDLKSRAKTVFDSVTYSWQKSTHWLHRLGVKLDSDIWPLKLEKLIEEKNIDVLVLDPWQRLHDVKENDASEIGTVWSTIEKLLVLFPKLSIIIIHHAKKEGEISDGLKMIRGSSRLAGECDVAILVDERSAAEPSGIKVRFIGRSIPQIKAADGTEIFKLKFDNGKLIHDSMKIYVDKEQALLAETKARGIWTISDVQKHFGVSTETVRRWLVKCTELIVSKTGTGTPVSVMTSEYAKKIGVINKKN